MWELWFVLPELWYARHKEWAKLGEVHSRARLAGWPWLAALAVSLPLAWICAQWGWLGAAVGVLGLIALIGAFAWYVTARDHAIGSAGLLLNGTFVSWADLADCQLRPDGLVECRIQGAPREFQVTEDFIGPLREALVAQQLHRSAVGPIPAPRPSALGPPIPDRRP